MSEDTQEKETVDETTQKIEALEAKNAALEFKMQQADDGIYDPDYIQYKQDKNKGKTKQDGFSTGSRITDFTEEQLTEMPMAKVIELSSKEGAMRVYEQLQEDKSKEGLKKQKANSQSKREELIKFAEKNPDIKKYLVQVSKLEKENPRLNIAQIYSLIEKEEPTKPVTKPKLPPNTRDTVVGGVKQSDNNLSYREIIKQEADKLTK
jgi:hypothetical protein